MVFRKLNLGWLVFFLLLLLLFLCYSECDIFFFNFSVLLQFNLFFVFFFGCIVWSEFFSPLIIYLLCSQITSTANNLRLHIVHISIIYNDNRHLNEEKKMKYKVHIIFFIKILLMKMKRKKKH